MTDETTGPGRRLTEAEEQRAAEMFAAGASERQVAAELGVGAGTANRLKKRLQAAQGIAMPGEDGDELPPEPDELKGDDVAELAALRDMRDALAEQLTTTRERAVASANALHDLEAERVRILGDGGDAVQLRERIASARADMDDWAYAAHLLTGKLAACEARIAEIEARRELAALRAELDAAIFDRDRACASTGGRQRAAVAAVRAAAEEFVAALADEEAAAGRVASLLHVIAQRAQAAGEPVPAVAAPASTRISVRPADALAGASLALLKATQLAPLGNVAAVSEHLGTAFGWLPPAPPTAEEIEQLRRVAEQRERQLAELQAAQARGIHNPEEDRLVPAGFDVDGVPVNRYGDRLQLRTWQPGPLDVFGYPQAGDGTYGPGYRTGF